MELTRRDAVAALATAGIASGGGVVAYHTFEGSAEDPMSEDPLRGMEALAEVLYPPSVEVTGEFVETYVLGRTEGDEEYREGILEAMDLLDREAEERHGERFVGLPLDDRDGLLRELGLQNTPADPAGDPLQRVRYYLIDDLLYALFTTPTGGELVGTENPAGYAGGTESYRAEGTR